MLHASVLKSDLHDETLAGYRRCLSLEELRSISAATSTHMSGLILDGRARGPSANRPTTLHLLCFSTVSLAELLVECRMVFTLLCVTSGYPDQS